MKKILILAAAVLVVAVVGGLVWLHAAPAIGATSAIPSYIIVNTPTSLVVTTNITDSSLLPGGVNLLKVDPAGKTIAILGIMHDDGVNGDTAAGDKVFSYRVSGSWPVAADEFYRVSAAFRGVLMRALSTIIPVHVVPAVQFSDPSYGFKVALPDGWSQTAALSEFSSTILPGMMKKAYELKSPTGSSFAVMPEGEFDAGIDLSFVETCRPISLGGRQADRCDYVDQGGTTRLIDVHVSDSSFRIEIRPRQPTDLAIMEAMLTSFQFL